MHAAIEAFDEIDRPRQLEVRAPVGLAIVNPHDAAKPLDDHRLPLVDKDHAGRRKSDEESAQRKEPEASREAAVGRWTQSVGRGTSELIRTTIDHGFDFSAEVQRLDSVFELPRLDGSDSAGRSDGTFGDGSVGVVFGAPAGLAASVGFAEVDGASEPTSRSRPPFRKSSGLPNRNRLWPPALGSTIVTARPESESMTACQ